MAELDESRLVEVSQQTIAALEAFGAQASRLANVEVAGSSPGGRVRVRVTGGGRVTQLRLRDGVLRRYDNAALGELVTRTVRDTQRRARTAYERAVAELLPPELAANEAEKQRIWRE